MGCLNHRQHHQLTVEGPLGERWHWCSAFRRKRLECTKIKLQDHKHLLSRAVAAGDPSEQSATFSSDGGLLRGLQHRNVISLTTPEASSKMHLQYLTFNPIYCQNTSGHILLSLRAINCIPTSVVSGKTLAESELQEGVVENRLAAPSACEWALWRNCVKLLLCIQTRAMWCNC